MSGISKAAALRAVAWDAYVEATGGLGFAPDRMIGYAARRLAEARFGIPASTITLTHNGDWGAALRSLKKSDPNTFQKMNILKKPRGIGYEPHTYREVPFGTEAVRRYIDGWTWPELDLPDGNAYPLYVETCGPESRFGGVLLNEKDGLLPVVRAAHVGERFDLMVATTEGQGVEAVKEFIEALATQHPGVRVFVLHDFDVAGTTIAATLGGRDSKSWKWSVDVEVIDLGLTLADVIEWEVEDESVLGKLDMRPALIENGCTREEIDYLISEIFEKKDTDGNVWRGRRAELNGLIGRKLIDYIEAKLALHHVEKVVPDADTLAEAWRRASFIRTVNAQIEKAFETAAEQHVEQEPPADLEQRIRDLLRENPRLAWDDAVARTANDREERK